MKTPPKSFRYFTNCVNWPQEDVDREGGLCDLIQACQPITRRTFLRQVAPDDRRAAEQTLGYSASFPMSRDWHVGYYRSRHQGRRVYLFKHSAIEYVFTLPKKNHHE